MFRRRNSPTPTHGWLIGNRIIRYFAWAFLILTFIFFVAAWTITYTIRRNCQDYYKRDLGVPSYWIHIEVGSTKSECPAPYDH